MNYANPSDYSKMQLQNGIDGTAKYLEELGIGNLEEFNEEAFHTLVLKTLHGAFPKDKFDSDYGSHCVAAAIEAVEVYAMAQPSLDMFKWHRIQIERFVATAMRAYLEAVPF